MSSEVVRGAWACAINNGHFICVETWSGYRGGSHADYKGRQIFLSANASDEDLGLAVRDALAKSRWVLSAPRLGSVYPIDLEFDPDLYDSKMHADRYVAWTRRLMEIFGYKTKRALFKDMQNCAVESIAGVMRIIPKRHVKLEAWEGLGPNNAGAVEIPAESTPAEIGSALRLAFTRCTA